MSTLLVPCLFFSLNGYRVPGSLSFSSALERVGPTKRVGFLFRPVTHRTNEHIATP